MFNFILCTRFGGYSTYNRINSCSRGILEQGLKTLYRRKLNIIFYLSLCLTIVSVKAEETAPFALPPPPILEARAYVLQDFYSDHFLLQKDVDERLEPASLTKIMTAYIVFRALREERIQLDEKVKISERAWRTTGSRMYLDIGSEVSVEQLLRGMIIQSGNDASIALAEHVAGSEEAFVSLMNEQAHQWELTNTHYTNTTGLPDKQHYSSAKDLAKIAKQLIHDFPEYYQWYSEQQFTYNGITQQNRNPLLTWDKSVDGMKTGYTESAGYCLITSALRGKMRLIAVVLGESGTKARAEDTKKMLTYGFQFFETYLLYKAKHPLTTDRIWYGVSTELQLGLQEPLYLTLAKGQYKHLNATVHVNKPITAPSAVGEIQGKLVITLANKIIAERPLIALHNVEATHVLKQLIDRFWLLFN